MLDPIRTGHVTVPIIGEAAFIQHTIAEVCCLENQRVHRSKTTKGEVGDKSQGVCKAVGGCSHLREPIQQGCTPGGVYRLSREQLHPLAVFVDTASMIPVAKVHIICRNGIISFLAGGSNIGLHLPCDHIGIGKIQWYIRVGKLIGGSDAITLVEDPIGMPSLPVSKVVDGTVIPKGSVVPVKRNVVGQEHIGIIGAIGREFYKVSTPDGIVCMSDNSWVSMQVK